MNQERIELTAKSKLEGQLSRLGYVTPEISSNDKTPSWDGFVRLYKNKDSSSSNELIRMIPVQLKGHYQKPPYTETISYDVKTTDLNNYLNDKGVIFFVVYIDEDDNYKIYYESLTRFKIRRLIKGKEKQNNIAIHFKSFPENKEEAVDIFWNFSFDMTLSLPKKDITLDEVFTNRIPGFDTFNITYRGIKYKNDPFEYFLTHPTTVNVTNSYTGISFPVDTINLFSVGSKHNSLISVNGVKYYETYEITRYKNNQFVLKFGKSFTFTLQLTESSINGKFDYSIKGTLPERIKDINFLLDYLNNKEFEINTHKGFKLTNEQINTVNINYFKNNLRLLEKIDELLKKLNIVSILNYDDITEENEKTFITLINTVLLGTTCTPDNPEMLYKIQLANIGILLIAKKIDEKNYKIINFFSEENSIECAFSFKETEESLFTIPKTFILREDDFITLDNIDFKMVYEDIIKSQTTSELKEYTYYFIHEMIGGYKKRTKEKKQFSDYLYKSLVFLSENIKDYDYNELRDGLV